MTGAQVCGRDEEDLGNRRERWRVPLSICVKTLRRPGAEKHVGASAHPHEYLFCHVTQQHLTEEGMGLRESSAGPRGEEKGADNGSYPRLARGGMASYSNHPGEFPVPANDAGRYQSLRGW